MQRRDLPLCVWRNCLASLAEPATACVEGAVDAARDKGGIDY
jgi:hypothetical protein